MNSLNTYWLCRAPGSAPEGPFSMPQLQRMYEQGHVTAAAMVCEHGTDQWISVDGVMRAMTLDVAMPMGSQPPAMPIVLPMTHGVSSIGPMMAEKVRRKVSSVGDGIVGVCFLILGGLCCVGSFWTFGLMMLFFGFLLFYRGKVYYDCGACGNALGAASSLCPTCRAEVRPRSYWRRMEKERKHRQAKPSWLSKLKPGERWALIGSVTLVAVGLLTALGFAGIQNIRNHNAAIEAEETKRREELTERNRIAREKHEAFLKTPEGQAAAKAERERVAKVNAAAAAASKAAEDLRWKPWFEVQDAFTQAGFNTLGSDDPKRFVAMAPFELASRISNYELKAICTMARNRLGEGAFVQIKDPAGVLLAQGDVWNVKAYK